MKPLLQHLRHNARKIVARLRRHSMYQWLAKTCWRGARREIRPVLPVSFNQILANESEIRPITADDLLRCHAHLSAITRQIEPIEREPMTPEQYRLLLWGGASPPQPFRVYHCHEDELASTLRGEARWRNKLLGSQSHLDALRDHYLLGTHHPDDQRIPLNKWDETP